MNHVVPVGIHELITAMGHALSGDGPAVAPAPLLHEDAVDPETALIVRTSGSTGRPREVLLSRAALSFSAAATHSRIGGAGHWVLALPADHIAGLQVLARAHAGGLGVTLSPAGERFTAAGFARLAARSAAAASGERRFVSLVPTQVHRLLLAAEQAEPAGLDALTEFDAVLLGGAAPAKALVDRARRAGVRVVVTYGMTETCGGCVYDGVPLDGVQVAIGDPGERAGGSGLISLSGPMLATRYLGDARATDEAFVTRGGTRWLRTSDIGRMEENGLSHVLHVLGRSDDVIISGGVNIAPGAVEEIISAVEGVGEACVVALDDPEWGQVVVAVVTAADPAAGTSPPHEAVVAADHLTHTIRDRVAGTLGSAAAPRSVVVVPQLPTRGPGKTDRGAVKGIAAATLQPRTTTSSTGGNG